MPNLRCYRVTLSPYRLSSLFSTTPQRPASGKYRCPPVGSTVRGVYPSVVISSIRGSGSTFSATRAVQVAGAQNKSVPSLAYLTGRDASVRESYEDVDVGHDLFDRTMQACAIPFHPAYPECTAASPARPAR